MSRIRYQGYGWASPVLLLALPFPLAAVATLYAPGALSGAVAALVMEVGVVANYLVGVRVNSTVTSAGRVFHDRHTFQRAPMQNASFFFGVIWLILAVAATSLISIAEPPRPTESS
ncbi:hypothetical protein GCM10027589_07300 [Actinocorallia lasiicapitis]